MDVSFREITDAAEIDYFLDRFASYVGVKLSRSYCGQGRTIGCYNDQGDLVGGYSLITAPKFRGLLFVPDQVKSESDFVRFVPEQNMMEVNGLWLSKEVSSKRTWLRFWRQVVHDIVGCKKDYIIVYYNSKISGLDKWYQYMGLNTIYRGPPQLASAQTSHSDLHIGYVSRLQMRLWLLKATPFILRKMMGSKRRGVEPKAQSTATHVPTVEAK